MAQMRATLFFYDKQGRGWTYTFYSLKGGYDLAMADAKQLGRALTLLIGKGVVWQAVRVSDDEVVRDSLFYEVPLADGVSPFAVDFGDGDFADVALLCRLSAGPQYWRPLYLSGIPDKFTQANGSWVPDATWLTAFDTFKGIVSGGAWAIKALTKFVPPGPPPYNIVTIQQQGLTGNLTVTTDNNTNFKPGTRVNITGVRGINGVNGRHVCVVPTNATAFTIRSAFVQTNPALSGRVIPVTYTIQPINDCQAERITDRKRGRFFPVFRGRRPAIKAH